MVLDEKASDDGRRHVPSSQVRIQRNIMVGVIEWLKMDVMLGFKLLLHNSLFNDKES